MVPVRYLKAVAPIVNRGFKVAPVTVDFLVLLCWARLVPHVFPVPRGDRPRLSGRPILPANPQRKRPRTARVAIVIKDVSRGCRPLAECPGVLRVYSHAFVTSQNQPFFFKLKFYIYYKQLLVYKQFSPDARKIRVKCETRTRAFNIRKKI